jgi:hypothetical protein
VTITSTEPACRAGLAARVADALAAVGEAAQVYDHERYSLDDFRYPSAAAGSTDPIHAYGDARGERVEVRAKASTGTTWVRRMFTITGYRTVGEATYASYRAEVQAVVGRLVEDRDIAGGIGYVDNDLPRIVLYESGTLDREFVHKAMVEVMVLAEEIVPGWTGG